MQRIKHIFLCTFICVPLFFFSQEISTIDLNDEVVKTSVVTGKILKDSLGFDKLKFRNPTKAALYSAILPGLGQVYNKKAWKVPIVWGLIGAGAGFIAFYQKRHDRFRSAFISELNGDPHEFSSLGLGADTLGQAQADEKRFRDYAIAATAIVYFLNILDAAVDAHLFEVRNDPDLTWKPTMLNYKDGVSSTVGLGLSYSF